MALAYLLTFRTYGTWLQGDERGWVTKGHNEYGTPKLTATSGARRANRDAMNDEPYVIDAKARYVIDRASRDVCVHRRWTLHALNVRTNHVHLVVAAGGDPERAMHDFKAWATRRLRETGLVAQDRPVWSGGGSTKHAFTPEDIEEMCDYVMNRQGAALPMTPP